MKVERPQPRFGPRRRHASEVLVELPPLPQESHHLCRVKLVEEENGRADILANLGLL
jgi:hypothetical protein